MYRILSVFLSIVILGQSVIACDMEHIIACHETMPSNIKHLSPVRGLALLDSPVLSNLRFFGMYGSKGSVPETLPYKQYNQLTRPKDHGLTATAVLIQYLFPSPADTFAITGRKTFLYKHLKMADLADLVLGLDGFCDDPEGKSKLETFLRGKVTGKSTRKELSKDFPVYTSMLLDAVKEARQDPYSFSPYFVQELMTAYAFELARRYTQYDFGDFLEKLAPGSRDKMGDYRALTKKGYDTWKSRLLDESVVSPKQLIPLKKDPMLAYQISRAMYRYEALPLVIPYGTAIVDGIDFSDCCESGLRSLVSFLLYDSETNSLDLSRIPDTATAEFKAFFDDYNPRTPDLYRSKWAALLANLKDGDITYKNTNEKTRCEVESGIPNVLRVFAEILGDPSLRDESLSMLERVKKLEALFSKGSSRYDVENDEDFQEGKTVKEIVWEADGIEFTFESHPGHTSAAYSNRNAKLSPAFSRDDLQGLKDVYVPLYANLFPKFFVVTPNRSWYAASRDYKFIERRDTLFSTLNPKTVYKLILSDSLYATDVKIAYIQMVLNSKLLAVNERLPALNHRIILCDPHSNMRVLSTVKRYGEELSDQAFPTLLTRLDRVIQNRVVDHFDRLTVSSFHNCFDIFLRRSVFDKLLTELEDPTNLKLVAYAISAIPPQVRPEEQPPIWGQFKSMLDALKAKQDVMLRTKFEPISSQESGDVWYPSFAANILSWPEEISDIALNFLEMLSDAEFEELCFQFSHMSIEATGSILLTPSECNLADPSKIVTYVLKRLLTINPQRVKTFKTRHGTLLNTLFSSETFSDLELNVLAERARLLMDAFGDDRDWVLTPDSEGKTIIQSMKIGLDNRLNFNHHEVAADLKPYFDRYS